MSQTQIAVFALVGVAGAISAPLAGIAADRGATGSALGAWAFARGGWDLTTWVASACR